MSPEERPAIYLNDVPPFYFLDVFAAIKSGQLIGAGISPEQLRQRDRKTLLPEDLRDLDGVDTGDYFLVERSNLDALINALVAAGYSIFARLKAD